MAALVAFGGFLGLFHALTAVARLTCIRVAPHLTLVSPEMDLLIILVCLASAWLLGYLKKDTFAVRTVGTRFYGREQTEQGYVATKWLTAGFPLLPIRSYVISYNIKEISNPEIEFQRNFMQPFEGYFHFPQMLRTAFISYATILWCLGCLWLMFIAGCI